MAKNPRSCIVKLIRDLEQLLTDVESFNDNRPDCQPFDVGVYRVDISMAKSALAEWDAGNHEKADEILIRLAARASD